MPGYYIIRCTGKDYTLEEQYTYHTFKHPVIIPEVELVYPAKFMNPMIITSHWYHEPNEAIPVMLKLKQVVMPYM